MKIKRFKITVEDTVRILSVVAEKNKKQSVANVFINSKGDAEVKDTTVTPINFAYAITNVNDEFNAKKEETILKGRLHKLTEHEVFLPVNMATKEVVDALLSQYKNIIVRTIISRFSDVKGKEVKTEEIFIKTIEKFKILR